MLLSVYFIGVKLYWLVVEKGGCDIVFLLVFLFEFLFKWIGFIVLRIGEKGIDCWIGKGYGVKFVVLVFVWEGLVFWVNILVWVGYCKVKLWKVLLRVVFELFFFWVCILYVFSVGRSGCLFFSDDILWGVLLFMWFLFWFFIVM